MPAPLLARAGVGPGDIVVWDETPTGAVRVRFRRRHTLDDLVGIAKGASGGDAARAKARTQRRA